MIKFTLVRSGKTLFMSTDTSEIFDEACIILFAKQFYRDLRSRSKIGKCTAIVVDICSCEKMHNFVIYTGAIISGINTKLGTCDEGLIAEVNFDKDEWNSYRIDMASVISKNFVAAFAAKINSSEKQKIYATSPPRTF